MSNLSESGIIDFKTKFGVSSNVSTNSKVLTSSRLVVIAGEDIIPTEHSLLSQDAIIIRSIGDLEFTSIFNELCYLVTESGFNLAKELIDLGRIGPHAPIIWTLGAPLTTTLHLISPILEGAETSVRCVAGEPQRVVVSTGPSTDGDLDLNSFHAGYLLREAIGDESQQEEALSVVSDLSHALSVLRFKHLNLLETLMSTQSTVFADEGAMVYPKDFVSGLESNISYLESETAGLLSEVGNLRAEIGNLREKANILEAQNQTKAELILRLRDDAEALEDKLRYSDEETLKATQRYALMEHKYRALSTSRLGRITLWVWKRRTKKANLRKSTRDAR